MDRTVIIAQPLTRWEKILPRLGQNQLFQTLSGNPAFRLFALSKSAGLFGGHFFQIALLWLIVKLTGSAAAMGTAILLTGLARMALIMVGGALSDRFSPRTLILASNALRGLLLALFLASLLAGWSGLIPLYGFCIALGFTDAVLLPARGLIVARLVKAEHLQAANSIFTGQEKAWGIVGPATAGFIVSALNGATGLTGVAGPYPGITTAFTLNLIAIGGLIFLIAKVRLPEQPANLPSAGLGRPRAGSIRELLALIWRQESLRGLVMMISGMNILTNGPLFVGLPMLAVSRFGNSAQALGLLSSASAGGALLGALAAGLLPEPPLRQVGRLFVGLICSLGAGVTGVWLTGSLEIITIAVLTITTLIGYINIVGITWIQRETPALLLGRMMALMNLK